MTKRDALRVEEHAAILALCEAEGFDMAACRAMSFRDLCEMWGDYQSDLAMQNGQEPGV